MQIKKKNQKSWIQEIRDEYQAEVKKLKRKKFLLKAKLILTVVLPVFIVLLLVKVIKTFVRIKIRSLFARPKEKPCTCGCKDAASDVAAAPEENAVPNENTAPARAAVPVPAEMTPVEKEIIKPVPVCGGDEAAESTSTVS